MGYVTTKDGVEIFYKDWGPKDASPLMFHHGWPLSSDDWDAQMLFFLSKGYRVVASDRRGHGRSAQVWDGHDMDHYAADASAVVEHLNLRNSIHIGHSTGGGQVARYVARHGEPQGRVADMGRQTVARAYSSMRHRVFAAILAKTWLEMRSCGYSLVCGDFSAGMLRLYGMLGFKVTQLGPAQLYWNEERYPILVDASGDVESLLARWNVR